MRDLIFKGKTRFQDFSSCEEGIATNVLTDRLRKLEEHGIISRKGDPTNARQILYAPTAKGLDLIPVMLEIVRWSGRYDPKTEAPPEFLRRLERDPDDLRTEIYGQFKPVRDSRRRR